MQCQIIEQGITGGVMKRITRTGYTLSLSVLTRAIQRVYESGVPRAANSHTEKNG